MFIVQPKGQILFMCLWRRCTEVWNEFKAFIMNVLGKPFKSNQIFLLIYLLVHYEYEQ